MSTATGQTDASLPDTVSHGPYGAIIVVNAFVDPSSATDYLKLSAPIVERFRREPECLFCELSQNPEDPGHIRIVHGWTKDTEWLRQVERQTHMQDLTFTEYTMKATAMWVKPRVIEHFDRVPLDTLGV